MSEESALGRISVSPKAVASIASEAVLRCYGVVGMVGANLGDGIAEILQVGHHHRGVQVSMADDEIVIDLYVMVEYGTRISEVAHNVMESVRFAVEKVLGMPVCQVNVHVQGLRISNKD